MLEQPALHENKLLAHLRRAYRLPIAQLTFLPLGADVNTAVYRADSADGRAFFLKLRRGPLAPQSVLIPSALSARGIDGIIVPLQTISGPVWTPFAAFSVALYPYIEGVDGYARALSEQEWGKVGATLKRIHTAGLLPVLRDGLPCETYSPLWRERVKAFQAQLAAAPPADSLAAELADILREHAAVIDELVAGAEQLARQLVDNGQEQVLCHGDLHAGNLLLGANGALYVVDWDTVLLAPKERDLMFVGSGLGPGWNEPRTIDWFYAGYGPTQIDPAALAYYRCERIVQDIAEYCTQILATTADNQDRSQALHYLRSQFEPAGVVAIALATWRTI